MKAKILLLSLATLLLGACQSENEPTDALNLLLKSESMEERYEFVTNTTAAMIQENASRYNCEIVEIALAGGDRVRICVKGAKDDLDALFDYVNEAGKERELSNPNRSTQTESTTPANVAFTEV